MEFIHICTAVMETRTHNGYYRFCNYSRKISWLSSWMTGSAAQKCNNTRSHTMHKICIFIFILYIGEGNTCFHILTRTITNAYSHIHTAHAHTYTKQPMSYFTCISFMAVTPTMDSILYIWEFSQTKYYFCICYRGRNM